MEVLTNHQTLGIRALARKIKLVKQLSETYPGELDDFELVMGENYLNGEVDLYEEGLSAAGVAINNPTLLERHYLSKKYSKLQVTYFKRKYLVLDPD